MEHRDCEEEEEEGRKKDTCALNEYHILEKIATGSFGVIFKVRRFLDNGIFIMKRIDLSGFDEKRRREAAQETWVMDQLHHPFIVAQRDAFLFDNDNLCIVMDFYDGGDLDALVARQREKDEYLSLECVMGWFVGMCLAIQYLHKERIVHRDLKTHNIFLDLCSAEVAIGDFGVAEFIDASATSGAGGAPSASIRASPISPQLLVKRCESEQHLGGGSDGDNMNGFFAGAVRGTLLYMAPEALEGGVCGPSSDVWSLGCILYELLSLRHPFESQEIAGLMVRVMMGLRQPLPAHYPPEVAQLVDRMLTLEAAKRPSCEEILRSPFLNAYLHRFFARRVPRDSPNSAAESTLAAQLRVLGVGTDAVTTQLPVVQEKRPMMPPSKERVSAEGLVAAALALASPRLGLRLSPGTSTFGDESFLSYTPLRHMCRGETASSFNMCNNNPTIRDLAGDHDVSLTCRTPLSNVEDMRHKSLECIEKEVIRYRQLVQAEIRAQKQQRDAVMLKKRFGVSPTSPLPADGPRYYNRRARSEPSKEAVLNTLQMPFSGGTLSTIQCSHMNGPEDGGPGGEGRENRSLSSFEASLVLRRQQRVDEAAQILGGTVFFVVYNYYKSVDVPDRDARWVMQLVPNRSHWGLLPVVEEVVVIDRLLERVVTSGPS